MQTQRSANTRRSKTYTKGRGREGGREGGRDAEFGGGVLHFAGVTEGCCEGGRGTIEWLLKVDCRSGEAMSRKHTG